MTVLMRCVDLAGVCVNGRGDDASGQYLKRYDPEAYDGRGEVTWTPDRAEARRFETAAEAMALWRSSPVSRPLREDFLPNRPLTAYTVELVREED